MSTHMRLEIGNIGIVEFDSYSSGNIYLGTTDTSPGSDANHSGLVVLKPKQARKIAKALLRAADQ